MGWLRVGSEHTRTPNSEHNLEGHGGRGESLGWAKADSRQKVLL